jgi:hypothetical protein
VLVEVVLQGGRAAGWRYYLGRRQAAEEFDVHGDRREHVLQTGFRPSSVATASHTVPVGKLIDRALHSGADRVAGFSLGGLLLGADAELQVAEFSWGKAHGPGTVGRGGALGAGGAGAALVLGESGHDQRGRGGRGGRTGAVSARADLALGAGDLLLVVVDVEVVPGKTLASAVLASGVAPQRPGDGDLVFTGGLFQVGREV